MARLQSLLRKFEEGLFIEKLNGLALPRREKVIAEMQARFDHLAGVPPNHQPQFLTDPSITPRQKTDPTKWEFDSPDHLTESRVPPCRTTVRSDACQ
jgi:hypothetical protein